MNRANKGISKPASSWKAKKMEAQKLAKIIQKVEVNIPFQTFTLKPKMELRVDVEEKGDTVTLELMKGTAEIFGAEITSHKKYDFTYGENFVVYTWQGCMLNLIGKPESYYAYTNTEETTMDVYLNCFDAIEKMRKFAEAENSRGPVVMVTGSNSIGKSSLCKILLNYGVRLGSRSIYVDLTVDQTDIGLPGTVGALHVQRPSDVNKGFQDHHSGPPLLLHFGQKHATHDVELFNQVVTKLARSCAEKFKVDQDANISGLMIDTCGWSNSDSIDSLTHTALSFNVDVICVVSNDKLAATLEQNLPDHIKIVNLPKGHGVIRKSEEERAATMNSSIKSYFYGKQMQFHPHRFRLQWNNLRIFELKSSKQSSAESSEDESPTLVAVLPSNKICHHLLAISFAKSLAEKDSLLNVSGFLNVTAVDKKNQTIEILSPQMQTFTDHILLWSEVQFVD